MDVIFKFFGTMLGVFMGGDASMGVACIMMCLIIKVIFAATTNKYYSIPLITEQLRPQVDEIYDKYRHNRERGTKEVSKFLISKQYPLFSFIAYYVAMLIMGALIAFAAHTPEKYIMGYVETSRSFLFVSDVSEYTFKLISTEYPNISLLFYLVFPVGACGLHYLINQFITDHYLVNKELFDIISTLVTAAACILLPQIFSIFWCAYEISNIVHLLLNKNRKNLKIKEDSPFDINAEDETKKTKTRKKKK